MNNKKLTKVLKKVMTTTMLGVTSVTSLVITSRRTSAATYTASKYFPGTNTSDDNLDNEYDDSLGNYFRNFKNRSANIYVKDKKVKKVFQKAAKAWKPVFKFKFVKSGKHANVKSSKYANVIVKKDGGSKSDYASVEKAILFAGSMKNLKQMHKDFPSTRKQSWYGDYTHGYITNYKKWKTFYKKLLANDQKAEKMANRLIGRNPNVAAPKVGLWMPSDSDAKKNSWNNYITVTAGTRGLTQSQQTGNATEILGEIIGIGRDANPIHEKDEVSTNEGSSYYTYKVTQSDLDHVNWIYAHPWSGSNYFDDND